MLGDGLKSFDLDRKIEKYEEELFAELGFDKYNLDVEYERQPSLYMEWSRLWGKGLLARKKAENQLEKVKGQVDLEIRQSPRDFGLVPDDKGKIMESAIKSAVANSEKVEEAQEQFYKVYELTKLLEYAVKAFEQRKELLRGEGELWLNQYYSGISAKTQDKRVDREIDKEEMQDAVGSKIAEGRQRRRKLG